MLFEEVGRLFGLEGTDPNTFLFTVIFYTSFFMLYGIFVFSFYKFLSKKNIFSLDLSNFEKSKNSYSEKISSIFLYVIEYIILLPIFIFIWFGVLSIFLMISARPEMTANSLLIISAAIIITVRILSYLNEQLSEEIAKVVPLTILVMAILGDNFFSFSLLSERLVSIGSLYVHIWQSLGLIVFFEFLMRILDIFSSGKKSIKD